MVKKDKDILHHEIKNLVSHSEVSIKGCKVTLNFLPESDEKTIETVKNILLSAYPQDIFYESVENLAS